MKHTFKKSLALLLTLSMLLGMFTGIVAVQTTTASAADAETVEVVTGDEFWEALDEATASKKPTVIKLLGNVSATGTVSDKSLYPHLQYQGSYVKCIVPTTCQIDLNGKTLTVRGVQTAAELLPKADSFVDATGKGGIGIWMWNGIPVTITNAFAAANRSKLVKSIQITVAINQKNLDMVVPTGVTLTGTAGVIGSKSLTFKSGAFCGTSIVRGTNGVIFECATTEDFLRSNIDKGTVIRLVADIRAGDIVINKGQTLDLNGHTLKCSTLTMNGTLKQNGGSVITGVAPYDLTPDVEAPADDPVADPMAAPANAKTYYVVDYIQADGKDDYIDTGILPTRYMRTDVEAEMANLVEGAIIGSTYTQEKAISDTYKSLYYALGLNADGTYFFRYNFYTSWKFNTVDLAFTGQENRLASGTPADAYAFPEITRANFRANYWLYNKSSSDTKITAEMIPYGSTESHQADVKTSTGNVTTYFKNNNVTMYVFANHRVDTAAGTDAADMFAPARVYSMQVYDSQGAGNYTIRASFLPVINEDGEVGLLDLVSSEFFGNKGSGNFKCGTILGEIAIGDASTPWYIVSSGAEAKVRAASVDSLAAKVRLGNPEKPVLLSAQYPELADTSRWSFKAMRSAVLNGLMKGDSKGKLNLTGNLTRAEAATIITRAFGANESADISSFKDVVDGQWYVAPMSRAVYMGVLNGADGKLLPNSPITREQVFTVLARALKLPAYSAEYLAEFSDAASVSAWAKESVAAMVANGYVNGSDGKLNPKAYITREQFAQVFYNIFKTYIQSGELYVGADGNVVINAAGAELRDVEAKLIVVGDGAADGDVTLQNVKVDTLVIRGGGLNTVHLKNTAAKSVVVAKPDGDIRVKSDSASDVATINVTVDGINGQPPKGIVLLETSTQLMNVASAATVRVQNATVQQLNAALDAKIEKGENANIVKSTTYVEPAAVEPEKPEEDTTSGGGGGGGGSAGGSSDSTVTATCTNHDYILSEKPIKEATCEADGYYIDYCKYCPHSKTRVAPALGHDFAEENVLIEEDGKMLIVQYCTRCGEYDHEHAREATADEVFSVEADKTELLIGGKALITVKNGKGEVIPATFSSTEGVEVDTDGVVTALAGGEAIVTATVNDLNQNVTVTVLTPAIDGDAEHVFTEIGEYFYFKMENMPEPGAISWESSNEKVVTVDAEGKAVAVANGKATVTAAGLEYTVIVDVPLIANNLSDLVTYLNLPALDGYDTKVIMAVPMERNGKITVPKGKTLDLNGNDLFVTGYVNEGTIVKNGGKLWAMASLNTTMTTRPTSADLSVFWAANEDLLRADTDLDGIRLEDNIGYTSAATGASKSSIAPNLYAANAFVNNSSLGHAVAMIPAGKTLDLNGHTFSMPAARASMGEGEIIANGGSITAYLYGVDNSVPNLINAIALKNSKHGDLITRFYQTSASLNFSGHPIPSGVTFGKASAAGVTNAVFECKTAADLTRSGTELAGVTIRLMNDIDAPDQDFTVKAGVTFDCNGYTLTCKTFSGPDEATFKTGEGGKVETESGIYTPTNRDPELQPTTAVVNATKTVQLTLLYAKKDVTWQSSDETVATVDQTGLVEGVKAGTATITATCDDKQYACAITVNPSNAEEVATAQELMNALDDRNAYITVTANIPAKTEDPALDPITLQAGQTLSLGTSTLKVSKVTVSAGATLIFNDRAQIIGEIDYLTPTISADEIVLAKDESTELTVSNVDGLELVWSSSDENVATVDQNGKVTAVAESGTAVITVTYTDGSLTCDVKIVKSTKVASKAELDAALSENNEAIKLTADIDYNDVLTIPTGVIIDLDDKNLYVTGLVNNGALTKNGGKLWANVSTIATLTAEPTAASVSNIYAAQEVLWQSGTQFDGVRLTADVSEAGKKMVADNASRVYAPRFALAGGFSTNTGIGYATFLIPAGKTLDLNGHTFTMYAGSNYNDAGGESSNSATFGAGTIVANGGSITLLYYGTSGSSPSLRGAWQLAKQTDAIGGFNQTTGTVDYTSYYIPAGVTLTLGKDSQFKAGTVLTFTVADEADFTRTGTELTGVTKTFRLANNITLTGDIDVGSANVNYNNFTVTGGKIITTGTETNKPVVPELNYTYKKLTSEGAKFTLELLNATATGWSSDHPEYAQVDNGVVTAVADGIAIITVEFEGGSLNCTVEVKIAAAPTGAANVKDATELGAALEDNKATITLTDDIDFNAVLTIPEGVTVDLGGHNLYVKGLVNNGTLTKNEGKLWANASTVATLSALPTLADMSNVWAAYEVLATADTVLDGIRLTAASDTNSTGAVNSGNRTNYTPSIEALGAYGGYTGRNIPTIVVPAGKYLDLNGLTLKLHASTNTMGEGTVIANGGFVTTYVRSLTGADADAPMSNALDIVNANPTVCNRIYALGAVAMTEEYVIPSGVTFGANQNLVTGTVVYDVANEADFSATRINTGNAKPTMLKLTGDLVLTSDVDACGKAVDYDNHTVTGGSITNVGTEYNKPGDSSDETKVASKADLDAAFAAENKAIKLTADIPYNAALTIPEGVTLDLNGHKLFVTGLVLNGTLTKNEGTLWAYVNDTSNIAPADISLANMARFWAANEMLLQPDTLLDGIRLGTNISTAGVVATKANLTRIPYLEATGAYRANSSNNNYFAPQIPAGKSLDLNGKTLHFYATTGSLGEGDIIDTAGTSGRLQMSVFDSNNLGTYADAVAIAAERSTQKIFKIRQVAGTIDYSTLAPIPANAEFTVGDKSATNVTFEVADEAGFTRTGTADSKATNISFKLVNSITYKTLDPSGLTIDLNGFTLTKEEA